MSPHYLMFHVTCPLDLFLSLIYRWTPCFPKYYPYMWWKRVDSPEQWRGPKEGNDLPKNFIKIYAKDQRRIHGERLSVMLPCVINSTFGITRGKSATFICRWEYEEGIKDIREKTYIVVVVLPCWAANCTTTTLSFSVLKRRGEEEKWWKENGSQVEISII